jgi:hypothetical protein
LLENVKFTPFLVKFTPCPPQSGPGYAWCSGSKALGRGQETRQGVNLTKKSVNLKISYILVNKFKPIFNLKNLIFTYTKGFYMVQEYRRNLFFFLLLLYLMYSQIWLNYLLEDRHLACITKSF